MRATFAIATFVASLVFSGSFNATNVSAEEQLFSEISMAEVFEDAETPTKISPKTKSTSPKLTSPKPTSTTPTSTTPKSTTPKSTSPNRSVKTQALTVTSATDKESKKTDLLPVKLSLVGTWSAAISDSEAFALAVTSERRFRLVHIKDGKTQTSSGIASKQSGNLTLTGDDKTTITGIVTQKTNQAFALGIKSTDGQVALTLKFNQAK